MRPSRSNQSLASSTLSHRSTYSVTIRDRQRHTTTEFPNANGHYDDNLQTPRNPRSQFNESNHPNGHALGLRSDPSVASLVELYDDHGRLPPETFSNSPPSPEKQGRQQKMRSGSTLRELLGATDGSGSATDSAIESDISWAERFLGSVSIFPSLWRGTDVVFMVLVKLIVFLLRLHHLDHIPLLLVLMTPPESGNLMTSPSPPTSPLVVRTIPPSHRWKLN